MDVSMENATWSPDGGLPILISSHAQKDVRGHCVTQSRHLLIMSRYLVTDVLTLTTVTGSGERRLQIQASRLMTQPIGACIHQSH